MAVHMCMRMREREREREKEGGVVGGVPMQLPKNYRNMVLDL